jgi:pimeloyl-ACP methyl ester carboxylesterase
MGANDLLIPVENANKFHKDLPINTLVILDNNGHIQWKKAQWKA